MNLSLTFRWTILTVLACGVTSAARLKDLVAVEGMRDNQLVGYGVVVGLAGTGDRQQTVFSNQSLINLLERMGVTVTATNILVKNTAAVMVTATLPPFGQPGTHIDVTVAAMGDCSNLQGGILVMTSLRGADGQVYAVAQGPVVTGGFAAKNGVSAQTVNHPTVGRTPNGATIERPSPSVIPKSVVHLQLLEADSTNAVRIADAINSKFANSSAAKSGPAHPESSGLVSVAIPSAFSDRPMAFLAELETVTVDADRPARVVINERTGTIVFGKDVHIAPVAILHGNLSVEIQTTFAVSQPLPLSNGTSEVVPQSNVTAKEEKARNVLLKQGATVEDLVHALAAIGSTPRDVIAILQSLRSAGALEADVEVM